MKIEEGRKVFKLFGKSPLLKLRRQGLLPKSISLSKADSDWNRRVGER